MAVVHLSTKANLTKREARWVEFLAAYDFTVNHKPGKENMADALSRRPDLRGSAIGNVVEEKDCPPILPAPHLNMIEFALELSDSVAEMISEAYQNDEKLSPKNQRLRGDSSDNLHERYYWEEESRYLYLRAAPNNR